ncbi:hypothetical protein ANME2D_00208 [Candidatus Methanoperedens nitroreducens]|uniref:Uncharacterized protein n=1 Tax=Candidatus Methanoperedens nitratireducens TaxID=1392998 RepID=A0A062VBR8_9EURY|nr:hypothetical protein [Candidatus Methanoperedens nitroreducens]KCZ73149.1 hypothetical protein ANME2D_00208 [Candidatus Methanoperedens nitroreducens]MDJ1422901.1 hypothetical protein [Candidatus Methanoperedens sp.]
MNKKSEINQKRPALINEAKKVFDELESWVIEEYFVPYQAS